MSKPANAEKMNALHEQVAEVLTELVTPKEIDELVRPATEDEEQVTVKVVRYPEANVLAVAVKFLKDNSVFATPEQSSATAGLQEALSKRKAARLPTKQDLKDAMAQIGSDLVQ